MAQNTTRRDFGDAAAEFLAARELKFAEDQAKLQADFEARDAKFNADLEAFAPSQPKRKAKSNSSGDWLLARKCWAWLRGDDT